MGTLKNKRSNMNNDAAKNANNQLITVQNEATPDAAFFAAAVASAIAPEANFLSAMFFMLPFKKSQCPFLAPLIGNGLQGQWRKQRRRQKCGVWGSFIFDSDELVVGIFCGVVVHIASFVF